MNMISEVDGWMLGARSGLRDQIQVGERDDAVVVASARRIPTRLEATKHAM